MLRIFISPKLVFILPILLPLANVAAKSWAVALWHSVSIVLASLWAITTCLQGRIRLHRIPHGLQVLIFVALACLSLLRTIDSHVTRLGALQIAACVFIYLFHINFIQNRSDILWLVWTIALANGGYAMVCLVVRIVELSGVAEGSLFAETINLNQFAAYASMATWLSLGLSLACNGMSRVLAVFLCVSSATALLFSFSRGGYLGLAIGFMVFIAFSTIPSSYRNRRRIGHILILCLLLLGAALTLGVTPIVDELYSLVDPVSAGAVRLEVWWDTLPMISDNPWLGTGLGTFEVAYPPYQAFSTNRLKIKHAYNEYLELAAEIGIPGAIAFFLCVAMFFRDTLGRLPLQPDTGIQSIGLGALCACTSSIVHSFFDVVFQVPSNIFILTLCATVAVLSCRDFRKAPVFWVDRGISCRWRWPAIVVVIMFAAYGLAGLRNYCLSDYFGRKAYQAENRDSLNEAVSYMQRAVVLDPGNSARLSKMGDLLYSKSRTERDRMSAEGWHRRAIGFYDRALALRPSAASTYLSKARSVEALGRFQEAEVLLTQAVALDPTDAYCHYRLASVYRKRGMTGKALGEYSRSFALDERFINLLIGEAWQLAPNYLQMEWVLPKTVSARKDFVRFLLARGEQDAVLRELSLIFFLDPSVENALAHLQKLSGDGQHAAALEAAQQYGNQLGPMANLEERIAHIYLRAGDADKAFSIYRGLVAAIPDQPQYYIIPGDLYNQMGRHPEALSVLRDGIARLPDNASLYFHLGMTYRRQGRYEDELDAFKTAFSLEPGNTKYCLELGSSYQRLKLYQQAVQTWSECGENPTSERLQQAVSSMLAPDGCR